MYEINYNNRTSYESYYFYYRIWRHSRISYTRNNILETVQDRDIVTMDGKIECRSCSIEKRHYQWHCVILKVI